MKKQFLLVTLTLLSICTSAADQSGKCGDNLTWTYFESTQTLAISGTGDMWNWIRQSTPPWYSFRDNIKNIVLEEGLTSVGSGAFSWCSAFTSVIIPNSVTSIGGNSFNSCDGLESLIIGNSVVSIGHNAFAYCYKLNSIIIPNSVTTIDYDAFSGCSSVTHISIGSGVKTIGKYAFSGCSNLTTLSISCSPSSMGKEIFSDCDKIKEVVFDCKNVGPFLKGKASIETITLKEKVTSIGFDAFIGCTGLKSIDIPEGVTLIGESAFSGCTGLNSIIIPEGVTSIGFDAFKDCTSLDDVNIPNSVTSIGRDAFYNTKWLNSFDDGLIYSNNWLICQKGNLPSKNIIIPEGTKGIASGALGDCSELQSVTIPSSVIYFGGGVFSDCINLTSVVMHNNLTILPGSTFYNCSSLTSITIPDGITKIEYGCFAECSSLTSITIPDGIIEIGDACFQNCSSLSSINIPETLSTLGNRAFRGCSGLTSISIPENVTYLGKEVFWCCSNCRNIKLPDKLEFIGENCFSGCTSLEKIEIPDNVSYIGMWAFCGCTSLTNVSIGKGIEMILQDAFSGTNIKELYIYADTPPDIRTSTFDSKRDCEVFLYVPYASRGPYQSAVRKWNYFFVTPIKEIPAVIKNEDRYWTTFYNGKHNYFANNSTTVYVAVIDESSQQLRLKEVEDKIIKKGEGVVLKSNDDILLYYTSQTANDDLYEHNDLKGADVETEIESLEKFVYILQNSDNGLGFYKAIEGKVISHSAFISCDKNIGFLPIANYRIIYIIDNEVYKEVECEYGSVITVEKEPTKEGYVFSGWSDVPEIMPDNNVIVKGSFTKIGDANGDGELNVVDIVDLVIISKGGTIDNFNFKAADINCDGLIDDSDISRVVSIIMGSENK